ncbi:MAG TPA: hypothetical protein VJK66_02520 [Gaiellaceae bacterium]|nr:hypothetical protein [Gaiellaceae bacterium]
MASEVTLVFSGDSRGAVSAAKAVESSLGSLKGATGEVGAETERTSSGVRQHWGAISLAAGGALAAIVAGGKRAGDAASDLGEQVNKASVVFRGSEKDILAWGKTTASSLGISNRAALEATGTFGNMLVPMGIARKEAAGMSKVMVGLAADMASFNNASPEETLDALRAGIAGETEPLRRFGVFLNQDRIELEALSSGLVEADVNMLKVRQTQSTLQKAIERAGEVYRTSGKDSQEYKDALLAIDAAEVQVSKALDGKVPKLTAAQKAQATYAIITKDTADAQGDFARTSDSVANQERIRAAVTEDSTAKLGKGLLPVMQTFNSVLTAGARFAGEHSTAVTILVGVFAALAVGVLAVNAGLALYRAAVVGATAAQWAWNTALSANPIGLVVIALAALAVGLVLAWQHSETFRSIVTGAFDAVRGAASAVLAFFRGAWQAVSGLVSGPFGSIVGGARDLFGVRSALVGAFEAVKSWLGDKWPEVATLLSGPFIPIVALATNAFGVRSALVGAFEEVRRKVTGALGEIRKAFEWFRENAAKLWQEIADLLAPIFARIMRFIEPVLSVLNQIESAIRWILRNASRIPSLPSLPDLNPFRQHGGPVWPGGIFTVGERGRELFAPTRPGMILPHGLTEALLQARAGEAGSALAHAGGVQVSVYVAGDFVGDEIWVERLATKLKPSLERVVAYRNAI